MQIEVSPKKYVFSFVDDEHYNEGDNTLSLSEGQFQRLLKRMCSIAHNEGWFKTIAEEITCNPIEENYFEKYNLNKDFTNKIKKDYTS